MITHVDILRLIIFGLNDGSIYCVLYSIITISFLMYDDIFALHLLTEVTSFDAS